MHRSTWRNPAPLPLVAFWLPVFLAPATLAAQTGDLKKDVRDLDIRHRTEHYEIAGTVSQDRLEEYGRCLEYIHAEYARGFEELIGGKDVGTHPESPSKTRSKPVNPPKPDPSVEQPDRFKVVVFADGPSYEQFTRSYFRGQAEHTRGLFVPGVDLLLIRDEPNSSETYEILFHEAFHQFVDRFIPHTPIWLNEGLATHYGTARPTSTGLAFDRPRNEYCRIVSSAASLARLIPFDEMFDADSHRFYNSEKIDGVDFDRRLLSYSQAYTLVAYMLFDEDGRLHIRNYMRKLAEAKSGKEAAAATREFFPPNLQERLVPAWLEFVRRH